MLNIRGETHWICKRGHLTNVWLSYDGEYMMGGSAWDFCSWCSQWPSPVQDTRMRLDIFGQWLREGQISPEEYAAMAQDTVSWELRPGPEESFLGLPLRTPARKEAIRELVADLSA